MTNNESQLIKLEGRNLYLNGSQQAIRLFPLEARLLAVLLGHPNQVVSRATLMREVWETDYMGDIHTLYVHISWLRRKIEVNPTRPPRLVTVRGVGYCLVVDDET